MLDRVLQENWLRIVGLSGTSAGAMNAGSDGIWLCRGGSGRRAGRPRRLLGTRRVNRALKSVSTQPDRRMARPLNARLFSAVYRNGHDVASFLVPRSQLGRRQPLRSILEQSIDFERLKKSPVRIFITATNV
ncbi:hypothetical protein [Bradyrhizobium sp. CCGB20]|uniref:hypothetical protein n=1 Tax=unclassified Bradyrhizobium TaxID=2631580 RepID=UPI0035C6751C